MLKHDINSRDIVQMHCSLESCHITNSITRFLDESNVTWAILTNEVAEKAIAQPDQMTYVTGSRGLVTPAARGLGFRYA